MPNREQYPTLCRAWECLVIDNIPAQIRDQIKHSDFDHIVFPAGLDLATAETELAGLSEEDLEECIMGEEGTVPVSPATDTMLQWLFEHIY